MHKWNTFHLASPIDMNLTNYADRDKLTEKELNVLDKWVTTVARTKDDAEGFAHFYAYMTRGDIPQHAYNWIDKVYLDKSNDMGTLIFAFRGSWKTTTISILFTAYRIGLEPWKSNLILGNNDASSQNITLAIIVRLANHTAIRHCTCITACLRTGQAKAWDLFTTC